MLPNYTFAEFFSGGGMVRAGLGSNWKCVLANDIDPKKCDSYRKNWSSEHLFQCDISDVPNTALLQKTDVYWASSPCQDFSLAGKGRGLGGDRSSAFFPWIKKLTYAVENGYAPKIIAFENVTGLLTANNGRDFSAVFDAIAEQGYRVGAAIIDAKSFLPHSRPRLFVIGVRNDIPVPSFMTSEMAFAKADRIKKAYLDLPAESQKKWIWWKLDLIQSNKMVFSDILDQNIPENRWFSGEQTSKLIEMMSAHNKEKVAHAQRLKRLVVGTIYKRGRPNEFGKTVQRAEIRLDGLAGCLRTPGGGSSKQSVMVINGDSVRARLLTIGEAAQLMGLPSWYQMPNNYNEAYRLAGDGVVVPVVEFLCKTIFEPIVKTQMSQKAA